MSDIVGNSVEDKESRSTEGTSMKEPGGNKSAVAADRIQQTAQTTTSDDFSGETPSTSASAAPPPGYRLVTVRFKGQNAAAVEDLPVEVLPCHTFADLCALALARVPDAPRDYGMQAFLLLGTLEAPLEDPLAPARDALRSFGAGASLRFLVDPEAAAAGDGGGNARIVRVSPLATPQRRRRQLWLRRLARVAIGVAKFVLAVEAAALLRGGLRGALRRLTGRGDSEGGSGDGGLGSETEVVMDAVADYVSGRGDIRALERFDPWVVRQALEAMDTEVLEQLDVPDVGATRAAVSELLREIRKDEAAAAAASSLATSPGAAVAAAATAATEGDSEAGPGPRASASDGAVGSGVAREGASPAAGGAAGGGEEREEEEGGCSSGPPAALPGFGPVPAGAVC